MASNSNTYLPSNPYYAYVNFAIGEVELNKVPPNHILSFSYDRTTLDSANVFQISVIDTTALALEFQLAQGYQELKFSYGYTGGPSSKIYTGQLTDYKLKFTTYGVQLDIEGVSSGLSTYGVTKSATYEHRMISDIVYDIAKEEGWKIGYIETTQEVFGADGKTYKSFTRNNTNAVNFITTELTPYAKSALTGASGYQLSFDDSTDPPTVNYHPPKVSNNNSSSENVNFYEFAYGTGGDSRVISFEPQFSGMSIAVQGASEVDVSTVDALRNEMFSITCNKDTNPNVPQTGAKTNVPNVASNTLLSSSLGYNEATNLAATMWFQQAGQSYGAILEIVGDPNLDPQSMCSVLIVNQDGLPHHSSGAYLITQITDSIEGGQYTTTLQLFRNALNVGAGSSGGVDISLNTNDYQVITGGTNGSSDGTGGTGGSGGGNGIDTSSGLRSVIDKYIGLPYVWGGTGPKGYDCSGFVSQVYKDYGILKTTLRTVDLINWGTEVGWDKSKIRPGDFIVYRKNGAGHVVMIVDENTIAHAPRTGDVIKYASIDYYWNWQNKYSNVSVRRPPGVGSSGLGNT